MYIIIPFRNLKFYRGYDIGSFIISLIFHLDEILIRNAIIIFAIV